MVDPATGVRIGLPTKLVPVARDAAHGTRWSSAHGEVQVETFRIKDPGDHADRAVRERKEGAGQRAGSKPACCTTTVSSSAACRASRSFLCAHKLRDGEIRGFTMMYDQMMEGIVSPVMVAMASAFSPFPERSAPYAALAKSVEYGTGLVVSAQGHIVTDLKLTQGCQVLVAAGLGRCRTHCRGQR